ncbi:MAG: transporter [Candidatus Brocadiaceae bacterium]|nr:transporter [Candidatus Brocadiaceae bacterium]
MRIPCFIILFFLTFNQIRAESLKKCDGCELTHVLENCTHNSSHKHPGKHTPIDTAGNRGQGLTPDDLSHKHISIEATGEHLAHEHDRPDAYAPIGVMGDHTHEAGTWMFSYRYMHMDMDGNRKGTDQSTDKEVLQDFMVVPTSMTMDMHMFGAMYSPSDKLTLMTMIPYIEKKMRHKNRMNKRFTTMSEGIGDLQFSALYDLYHFGRHHFLLNGGISLPTGSIDEEDDTPMGQNQQLPYPMQLGSGTFDLLPGVTYLGHTDNWSWGVQTMGTIRTGDNDNHYTLGNRFALTNWIARRISSHLSSSFRIAAETWGNIKDEDPELNPKVAPTADADRRGGTQVDLFLGLNFKAPKGFFDGHRLSVEAGSPVYQNLDGPQLETDWRVTAGWQYEW